MPPKGGVSLEEKRRRILTIFKDTPEVYSLKEIEQIGTKKGVVTQTIKDILKGLCDDNLVDSDKIGSGNFFWALPSKDGQRKRIRLDILKKDVANHKAKRARLQEKVQTLHNERKESQTRQAELEELQNLKSEEGHIRAQLQRYSDRDPAVLTALSSEISKVMDSATLWGHNLSALVEHLRQKQGRRPEDILALIGAVESDFEPIDWETFNLPG